MDVEQEVGGIDDRTQITGPGKLGGSPGAVESGRSPQPIEIFVHKARSDRDPWIEIAISGDVVEGQGQLALPWPPLGTEQTVERDRAADLVAMGQRSDENV